MHCKDKIIIIFFIPLNHYLLHSTLFIKLPRSYSLFFLFLLTHTHTHTHTYTRTRTPMHFLLKKDTKLHPHVYTGTCVFAQAKRHLLSRCLVYGSLSTFQSFLSLPLFSLSHFLFPVMAKTTKFILRKCQLYLSSTAKFQPFYFHSLQVLFRNTDNRRCDNFPSPCNDSAPSCTPTCNTTDSRKWYNVYTIFQYFRAWRLFFVFLVQLFLKISAGARIKQTNYRKINTVL